MAKTKTCWRVMLIAGVLIYAIFSHLMICSHRMTTVINFTIRWVYRQAGLTLDLQGYKNLADLSIEQIEEVIGLNDP